MRTIRPSRRHKPVGLQHPTHIDVGNTNSQMPAFEIFDDVSAGTSLRQ